MLEFIVLGQIPGTNFYISFTDYSAVFLSSVVALYVYTFFKNKHIARQQKIVEQTI